MVELEQAREGLYFRYRGSVIRIREVHFPFLPAMRHELEAIPIESNELYMLGFNSSKAKQYGEFEKYSDNGRHLWLKKSTQNKGWTWGIGEANTESALEYVNELQDLWFLLFREVLRRKGDEPPPPIKMTYRIMGDKHVSVPTDVNKTLGRSYGKLNTYSERTPYPEQLYYLTWDCCYLIRNIQYAIWKVTNPAEAKDTLFELAGTRWGLYLIAGKGTSEADTRAAAKWMQNHLLENNLQTG